MRRIDRKNDLFAVQARSVDDAADADASMLRAFERHAVMRSPGPDGADRKVARDARDFVLCRTVELALTIMNTGTRTRLHAESDAGGDCGIRGDSRCECGATGAGDVCCS